MNPHLPLRTPIQREGLVGLQGIHSELDPKLDILLTPTDAAFQDGEYDRSNVLVIGKHK